jgi:Eco29kI restriction endonuclease
LHNRLREHSRSITVGAGLSPEEFMCRFVILEDEGSDMISTIEAALIKLNQPLWNVAVDGFGNHDPGQGRYEQAKSDWDVIHPGRPWTERCNGVSKDESVISSNIERHFNSIERKS